MNRTVLRRAFGALGPTEAFFSMFAFLASLLASGWRPGQPFPEGAALASASGAAFMAIVLAQAANAFVCRSSTRTPFAMSWRTNRLLPAAVLGGITISLTMVFVGPIADELGQANPTTIGWLAAALAPVAVLIVDSTMKRHRRDHLALVS